MYPGSLDYPCKALLTICLSRCSRYVFLLCVLRKFSAGKDPTKPVLYYAITGCGFEIRNRGSVNTGNLSLLQNLEYIGIFAHTNDHKVVD